MAPYADEIDVYKVPHSRIKRLVHLYLNKVSNTNFSSCDAMHRILTELHYTFNEFKCHEQIENDFIIKKLKNKLNAISLNSSHTSSGYSAKEKVCNCHNDNRLIEMLALFENGLKYDNEINSVDERVRYGHRLIEALDDFTKHFLPHMKEEEEVFQPMLMRYFTYDELKALKKRVLLEHVETWKERERAGLVETFEPEKFVAEQLEQNSKNKDESAAVSPSCGEAVELPREVLERVFTYLSVPEVCRAGRVSHRWFNIISSTRHLWTHITPHTLQLRDNVTACGGDAVSASSSSSNKHLDEDADVDESSTGSESSDDDDLDIIKVNVYCQRTKLAGVTRHLLPKIGQYIEVLDFSSFTPLTSSALCKMLSQCGGGQGGGSSLKTLIVSDTNITDSAFKCLDDSNRGGVSLIKLEHLDVGGCSALTDVSLIRIINALSYTRQWTQECGSDTRCVSQPVSAVCTSCPLRGTAACHVDPGAAGGEEGGQRCPLMRHHHRSAASHATAGANTPLNSTLTHLSVSGCHHITDHAIRHASSSVFLRLCHVDLSGCPLVSAGALHHLVTSCPTLPPHSLYYCDNITDGPHPRHANGCHNVDSDTRVCCRTLRTHH